MNSKIIQAPWAVDKVAEALARTPGAIRSALYRGTFPLKPRRILGRVYFDAADVQRLLCPKGDNHA